MGGVRTQPPEPGPRAGLLLAEVVATAGLVALVFALSAAQADRRARRAPVGEAS